MSTSSSDRIARRRPQELPGPAPAATLFYDADCGLCRWTAAKIAAWDRGGGVRLVTLQDRAEADRLLGAMDDTTRMASWHLVTADGTVHSAGAGVAPLLERLPHGALPARLAAAAQPLTNVAYRFVADHRSAFGRLLSHGARARADARLGATAGREASTRRARSAPYHRRRRPGPEGLRRPGPGS